MANLSSVARARPMMRLTRFERSMESLLVPAVRPQVDSSEPAQWRRVGAAHDFRRVIAVVAVAAVGFFPASLVIAGVPVDRWPLYLVAAGLAGVIIAGSFVLVPSRSPFAVGAALLNVAIVAGLARLLGPYYHELVLLFTLIVAGHAIVHGLFPGLAGAVAGGALVPFVVQQNIVTNPTDPVYAVIYLTGAALLPWTAGRLAERRASALTAQLRATVATEREAVLILARASEAKDHVTGDHVMRVADIAAELGARTGMSEPEVEDLRFAGMLHDVGKLHVPDSILLKTGKLNAEEWVLVKEHTIWGERILGSTDGFELARRIARSHHENFNGSGYPDGLRGNDIPLAARIVRLADVLDALANSRPYKEAWELADCLEEIQRGSATLFDPELTRELIKLFDTDTLRPSNSAIESLDRLRTTAPASR